MGKLGRSTVSMGKHGGTIHVPKPVLDFYNIENKDIFEWYFGEIPVVEENECVGIWIRRMGEKEK